MNANMQRKIYSQREKMGVRLRKEFHQQRKEVLREKIETGELKDIIVEFIQCSEDGQHLPDVLEDIESLVTESQLTSAQIKVINDLGFADDLISIIKNSTQENVLTSSLKIISTLTGYSNFAIFSSSIERSAQALISKYREVDQCCKQEILWTLGNLFSHRQSKILWRLLNSGFMQYLTSQIGTIILEEDQMNRIISAIFWFSDNFLHYLRKNEKIQWALKQLALFVNYLKALAQKMLRFALTSMNFGCELFPLCQELIWCGQNLFDQEELMTLVLCKLEEKQCIQLLSLAIFKFQDLGIQVFQNILRVMRIPDVDPAISTECIIIITNIIASSPTGRQKRQVIQFIAENLDNGHLIMAFDACNWDENAQKLLLLILKFSDHRERFNVLIQMCSKKDDLTQEMASFIDSESI